MKIKLGNKNSKNLPQREKYDDEWWIGRVISPDPNLGFIPSPLKIEKIRASSRKARKSRIQDASIGTKDKKGEKSRTPYEVVPNVRPVILVGPSLKGYEGIKSFSLC